MVMDHAPVMSDVVEYRLPEREFCAVTVTPGKGVVPLFTWPWSFPPATCADSEVTEGAAGEVAGDGVGAVGDCARAMSPAITRIPIATANCIAVRRIRAPMHLAPVVSQTGAGL